MYPLLIGLFAKVAGKRAEIEDPREWPFVTVALPGADGGLTLLGSFCDVSDFGDGLTFNDGCDAFIARYDASGAFVRKAIINGANSQFINWAFEVEGEKLVPEPIRRHRQL